jgi:tetraacyldisaccharide 4'-kinase
MFSNFFLKSFRILLLPFALLYGLIIAVRNLLYDKKIIRSYSFGLPLICVGNLSVGGTGKSPMVEYLITLLKPGYKIATLSRGYKRKTKGYSLAGNTTTALEIGDEPMQFHKKFPDIAVAVGEERVAAIPQILHDRPGTEVIILDDAFQHRSITAGLNILLTEHNNLFTDDFYLPTGDLRDLKKSYKRAQIIVVTKCRPDLDETQKRKIVAEVKPTVNQSIYFTTIDYGTAYHILNNTVVALGPGLEVLLVSGIANPEPLKIFLEENSDAYSLMQYADHHIFTIDDLKDIRKRFAEMGNGRKIILTTEKDAVRLAKFHHEISDMPLFVLPIRHHFLFNEAEKFNQQVTGFIRNFKKQS